MGIISCLPRRVVGHEAGTLLPGATVRRLGTGGVSATGAAGNYHFHVCPGAYHPDVGLATRVVTTTAGTGSLKIALRHQPGTKNGTFAPGDTDIEATFPVTVQ